MKKIVFALHFFSTVALGSEFSPEQISALEQTWLANEPKSYRYTLRHGAGPFGSTIQKIIIRNGICKARSQFVFHGRHSRWEKSTCKDHTIKDLIISVQEQESRGVFRSKIQVNERYGFISSYYADPITDDTDQDWHFEVSNFKLN